MYLLFLQRFSKERLCKATLNEFYRVVFQKKIYQEVEAFQLDLAVWFQEYSEHRPYLVLCRVR